jgi:preprotein translocase subunit SecD
MSRWLWAMVAVLMGAACGSAAHGTAKRISTAKTTTTVARSSDGSALTFREVLATIPYSSSTPASVPADVGQPASCDDGRLVTAPTKRTPGARVVLADAQKVSCFVLGPTLLTGRNVGSADAVSNPTTGAWEVNVHFDNDDFVKKVASVEVDRQIAIVLDGVVQSAPTVTPGIAGRDVTVSGDFDEATARHIAARIGPSGASSTPKTPTTT